MTDQKIIQIIEDYRRMFKKMDIVKIDVRHEERLPSPFSRRQTFSLGHCYGMLDKMEIFLKESRREKVMRWLGFIQGVLWVNLLHSLEDLMKQSMPDKERFQARRH